MHMLDIELGSGLDTIVSPDLDICLDDSYHLRRERGDLRERGRRVAAIAAAHAIAVDRDALFPTDAIAAAKQHGLFALLVPRRYGGEEASLTEVAEVCYTLAQACASTAMILAMHQAALACVVRHHHDNGWHQRLLRRIATENLLLASSTTEGRGGGNVRASTAALRREDDMVRLARAATVMSYGAQADGIVTTARRDADAVASDQALAVFLKEDYQLASTGHWDTLGMRGTCSAGFALDAKGSPEQILPISYDKIHVQTMVPVSHLVWASVWTGIAASAVARTQMFVRTAARRAKGEMPPGVAHCTKASASLHSLRGIVASALANFERVKNDELALGARETQMSLNLFKVEASDLAVATVMSAQRACGLAGYRNDGDFGIGRHLRDVLSAPIMIHNERILSCIATTTLLSGVPLSLRD